jgi:type I restriction enzyme R subunit
MPAASCPIDSIFFKGDGDATIYLDKPMRAHTLMQTIARANRVAPGKESGLIVDYVGIFRALQNALVELTRSRGHLIF